jgi:hypothetical protein
LRASAALTSLVPGKELAAGELVAAFEGLQLEAVYLDAAAAERGESRGPSK